MLLVAIISAISRTIRWYVSTGLCSMAKLVLVTLRGMLSLLGVEVEFPLQHALKWIVTQDGLCNMDYATWTSGIQWS